MKHRILPIILLAFICATHSINAAQSNSELLTILESLNKELEQSNIEREKSLENIRELTQDYDELKKEKEELETKYEKLQLEKPAGSGQEKIRQLEQEKEDLQRQLELLRTQGAVPPAYTEEKEPTPSAPPEEEEPPPYGAQTPSVFVPPTSGLPPQLAAIALQLPPETEIEKNPNKNIEQRIKSLQQATSAEEAARLILEVENIFGIVGVRKKKKLALLGTTPQNATYKFLEVVDQKIKSDFSLHGSVAQDAMKFLLITAAKNELHTYFTKKKLLFLQDLYKNYAVPVEGLAQVVTAASAAELERSLSLVDDKGKPLVQSAAGNIKKFTKELAHATNAQTFAELIVKIKYILSQAGLIKKIMGGTVGPVFDFIDAATKKLASDMTLKNHPLIQDAMKSLLRIAHEKGLHTFFKGKQLDLVQSWYRDQTYGIANIIAQTEISVQSLDQLEQKIIQEGGYVGTRGKPFEGKDISKFTQQIGRVTSALELATLILKIDRALSTAGLKKGLFGRGTAGPVLKFVVAMGNVPPNFKTNQLVVQAMQKFNQTLVQKQYATIYKPKEKTQIDAVMTPFVSTY